MQATPSRSPGRPVNPEAREQRRQQILEGARRCFEKKGFHAASIADISKAAGVSVANLYQYFPSKRDLVLAIAEQDLESDLAIGSGLTDVFFDRVEGVLSALAEEARQREISGLRVEILAECIRNREMAAAMVRMDSQLTRVAAEKVKQAQESGEVDPELDPAFVASMVLRLIDGFYLATSVGLIDPEAMIPHLGQLLRRGLMPRPAGKRSRSANRRTGGRSKKR